MPSGGRWDVWGSGVHARCLRALRSLPRTSCMCAASVGGAIVWLLQVLRVAQGDMRKGITFLQSAASLYGNTITPEGVVEISGVFPDKEVDASVSGGRAWWALVCRARYSVLFRVRAPAARWLPCQPPCPCLTTQSKVALPLALASPPSSCP